MDLTDCVPINLSDDEEVEDVADDDGDEYDMGSYEGQNKGEGDHDEDNDDDVDDDASKGTCKKTSPESGLFYFIRGT